MGDRLPKNEILPIIETVPKDKNFIDTDSIRRERGEAQRRDQIEQESRFRQKQEEQAKDELNKLEPSKK